MQATIDRELIAREYPPDPGGSIYLNSGSCGRKPLSVLRSWQSHVESGNANPTRFTFIEGEELVREARLAASELFAVDPDCLLLTNSTTQGLQLIMESFLVRRGDELVTTDHEHGITKTICRHLEESRDIIVHRVEIEPLDGSAALSERILSRVSERTRLVLVSEIDCYSGWRPDLGQLADALDRQSVPLLVDGAHAPGQGPTRPARYPLWVGSGHKWLGGPNGTGFAYASPALIPHLKPLWLGDRYYNYSRDDIRRFEYQGTADFARWPALAEALRLNIRLGDAAIAARQRELTVYLRERIAGLPGLTVRTPALPSEASGMVTFTFGESHVPVNDLREWLWQKQRIWIQPDFYYGAPGHGMRVSCHFSTGEEDIDRLVDALAGVLA